MSEPQNEYETGAEPTPGPWEVNHDGPCPSVHAKDSSDSIAAVLLSADPSSDRDVEANARLIAAAPDMLKALKLCKHQIQEIASQAGHDPGIYKAYTMVEDAIAKAEGEA
jgi:hypothetical protein